MGMKSGRAHGLGTHGWRSLVATLAAALLVTLGATSASAAKSATCSVTNTDSGRTYPRLQQAVDAAKPGAHLVVRGTCHGGTFIDKEPRHQRAPRRARTGKPVLDGGIESFGKARPSPDHQAKVKVNIRGLVIRDGKATRIPNGGGISNKGKLTLRDVVVRGQRSGARRRHLQRGGAADAGPERRQGQHRSVPLLPDRSRQRCLQHRSARPR